MARIGFVTWAGGGNVTPAVTIGRRLHRAGHDVFVIGPMSVGERVDSAGLDFVPRTVPDQWDVEVMATSVRDLLITHAHDVAIVDYMLSGAICGAEATGRPVAALVHTLYAALLVDGAPHPMGFATTTDEVNAARRAVDLDPVGSVADLLDRVDSVLVTCPSELDTAVPALGSKVRYVGAMLDAPGAADVGWRTRKHPERPLVVVSLGTTPMDEGPVLQRVLDELADRPVEVLALAAGHLRPETFRTPPNAQVTGYVRHGSVFPDAAVVVTHAGLGTVLAALRHAVPLVCIPLGREQPDNAVAVERVGAGVMVSPEDPPGAVASAVDAVLGGSSYRIASRQMADCFLDDDEPGPVDDAINQLVDRARTGG
ncbi:MAG: glycosyltransferase [Acidimicrobiales bacterium]